jgi:hypothetical protein
VTLHGSFQTVERLYFVIEYCAGGEFFRMLQRLPHKVRAAGLVAGQEPPFLLSRPPTSFLIKSASGSAFAVPQ